MKFRREVSGVIRRNGDFGGSIKENVSDLEGSRRQLCSNSLLFEAWKAWKCTDFQVLKGARNTM